MLELLSLETLLSLLSVGDLTVGLTEVEGLEHSLDTWVQENENKIIVWFKLREKVSVELLVKFNPQTESILILYTC